MATGQRPLVHDIADGKRPVSCSPSKAKFPPRKFGRLILIPSRWPLMDAIFQKSMGADFLVLISELIQLLLRVSAAE
jgi:hypothetical protein